MCRGRDADALLPALLLQRVELRPQSSRANTAGAAPSRSRGRCPRRPRAGGPRARSAGSTRIGQDPGLSHASSELSTGLLDGREQRLAGIVEAESGWRFAVENSETEISRCFMAASGCATVRSASSAVRLLKPPAAGSAATRRQRAALASRSAHCCHGLGAPPCDSAAAVNSCAHDGALGFHAPDGPRCSGGVRRHRIPSSASSDRREARPTAPSGGSPRRTPRI